MLSPSERNALAIEEAVAGLTHQCRFRPKLKLMPGACELRKSKRQKIVNGKSYASFWECTDCPGPVPIESKEPPRMEDEQEMRKPKYDAPSTCRTCGLSPGFVREDGTDVRFYPSRPDECIACIKKRQAARKGQEQKGWKPIVNEPQIEESPAPPVEEQRFRYHCPEHGPHNGRVIGRNPSTVCPECHRAKKSAIMKRIRAAQPIQENGKNKDLPDWVLAWCSEQGRKHNVSPLQYLVGLVGEQIPAEWFKEWLTKGASQ